MRESQTLQSIAGVRIDISSRVPAHPPFEREVEMSLCIKCGTWHSSKECPPAKRITCLCGNSFLMPWDAAGMVDLITCGNCGRKMTEAKVEDET